MRSTCLFLFQIRSVRLKVNCVREPNQSQSPQCNNKKSKYLCTKNQKAKDFILNMGIPIHKMLCTKFKKNYKYILHQK